MELIQSKSLLAKLMATENLTVEQRNVPTAFFNVKERLLVVPILDSKISTHLYDLFMGHEVGHALHTPMEGYASLQGLKISKSVVNVIEDVRIERKIKDKYPGLRLSFVKAYGELYDKDFFGTNGTDLNILNFIDRANLFYKGGAGRGINFTEFEKTLLDEMDSTETFEDVIELSKKVMGYLKEEKEEKQKLIKASDEEAGESGEGYSADEEDFDEEDFESNESEKEETTGSSGDDKEKDDEEDTESSDQTEEVKSHTDEAYHQNESKLFANSSKFITYGNIPKFDLTKMVIDYKIIWKRFDEHIKETSSTNIYNPDNFNKIRKDAANVVSYLSKEFELKKNAEQMKRASTAKTGDLDMKRIHSYKFSDDIFKKMTVIPGGKSHGLVMFLDWSGSMTGHMESTIKQLINLTMFCKKVNIPYEVYAFTSEYQRNNNPEFLGGYKKEAVPGDIETGYCSLMNLLSSRMSPSEYNKSCICLINFNKSMLRHYYPHWLRMGGTPLNEAIMAAMDIIPEFQKKYKLQIVNTVFLTDGEGSCSDCVWREIPSAYLEDPLKPRCVSSITNANNAEDERNTSRSSRQLIFRDTVTKNEESVKSTQSYHSWTSFNKTITATLLTLLKKRTGCNVVGFYILNSRNIGKELECYYPNAVDSGILKIKFRKDKYLVVTSAGYDEYYLLKAEGMDTDEDVDFEVKENATTKSLVNAFSKYTSNRISNRVVLNKFINQIT